MQIQIENLFKTLKSEADFVAFKTVTEKTRDLSVRNGRPDDLAVHIDCGLTIEIMVDGHIGYGATCEITESGIQRAFKQAKAMTVASSKIPVHRFDLTVRPASQGSFTSARQKSLDQISISEIYDFLKKTSSKLKVNDKIISAVSDAMVIETEQNYISSVGSDFQQN
ncbi:MAG: TldD/PmbA family protein, partial [Moraxellaceae bacterium]|nr:TldD/PmbA family protein [Pseudobdellovibrionaceae bacterium]